LAQTLGRPFRPFPWTTFAVFGGNGFLMIYGQQLKLKFTKRWKAKASLTTGIPDGSTFRGISCDPNFPNHAAPSPQRLLGGDHRAVDTKPGNTPGPIPCWRPDCSHAQRGDSAGAMHQSFQRPSTASEGEGSSRVRRLAEDWPWPISNFRLGPYQRGVAPEDHRTSSRGYDAGGGVTTAPEEKEIQVATGRLVPDGSTMRVTIAIRPKPSGASWHNLNSALGERAMTIVSSERKMGDIDLDRAKAKVRALEAKAKKLTRKLGNVIHRRPELDPTGNGYYGQEMGEALSNLEHACLCLEAVYAEAKPTTPNVPTERSGPESDMAFWGLCPHCFHNDGCLNIGPSHFQVCHQCKTCWNLGANLFSAWRHEDEETWKKNAELLYTYKEVSPVYFHAEVQPGYEGYVVHRLPDGSYGLKYQIPTQEEKAEFDSKVCQDIAF
jgi:hypothetical protein